MAIRVKLPTGDIGEFPDDMSHEEIESVLQKQFPPEEPEDKQESEIAETPFNRPKPMELELNKAAGQDKSADWRGLAGDTVRMLGDALKGGVNFLGRAPGNLKEIGSELMEHPLSYPPHVAQQVLAGLVGGTRDLANVPHKIFDELADKNITPNWLRTGSIPEDTGVEKALGLEPTKKSDELLRAIPALYGGGKLLTSGVKKVTKKLGEPSKEMKFQRALEQGIDDAKVAHNLSKDEVARLKDSLTEQFSGEFGKQLGKTTPVGQKESINVAKAAIEEAKPKTEIPHQEVGEIPAAPDTKGMIAEHKNVVEKAKAAAEENLGTLDNPKLKAGAKVKAAIKDLHQSASDMYKAARQHYVDKKITADNSKEIKAVTSDLESLKNADELAPGYGSGTAEQKGLESQLEKLKGEKVNASDIFDLQRTLEKMAEDTRKKQYSGVNELEFKRLGGLAERLDSHADKLATRLESVGGKEVEGMIKEANKGWKTYKDLSKKNPVGKASLKGDVPNNAMIELAKDHPGNEFLRGLVDSDPELKKHLLAAYSGEANVNKLIKPTTLTKKYLQDLPEVEEHVNALKNAISDYKAGETKASKIDSEYKALVKSMKDAANEQKTRQDAIVKTEQLKKQIKFHEDALPKLETKIKAEKAHSANVEKLAKELKEHKKAIQDKGGMLKDLASLFVKVKLMGKVHL